MKRYYFTVLACLLLIASYSQNNQAIINNGQWNNNANWTLGHVPANGEMAIIPQNVTLVIDDNIVIATEITLKIYGILNFQVGKLKLSGSSAVYVYPGGAISSQQGNASDKIEINGVSKYSGDEGTLTGPLMANAGTYGFDPMPIILPVKFIAYNISNSGSHVSVNWSTTEEENTAYYQVERSNDGITWQAIVKIEPLSKPGIINNYTYTDKETQTGLVYYRIKEVDKDGDFIYTSIKNIKPKSIFPELKISSVTNNLIVEFSQQVKGNVMARLCSLSGQVIVGRVYYQPQGNIILEKGAYKGHCILSLINEDGVKIVQQVFLN